MNLTQAPISNNQSARLLTAQILSLEGRCVQLDCIENLPWALLAVSPTYQPVVGDKVLAITQGDQWYVIGVIEGRGSSVFTAPGDMEFHAPNGSITLLSSEGIKLQGDKVELKSNFLEFTAKELFERFGNVTRWIRKTLHLRAGRVRARVDGDHHLSAGRITQDAEGDVTLRGTMINLN
jgi:hypothetical protein